MNYFNQFFVSTLVNRCIAKASFVERNTNILINDNVACEITDSGHVLIPVDNLHRRGRFDMNIEVTLTSQDGTKVFVTPVPMWLTVNPSILSDAVISDESKGSIPDLIREASEALKEAKNYSTLNNKPSINGVPLIGNKTTGDLHIEGGSNIASGTINTNGTITFRDKGGTELFTTDGESVIGKKGDTYTLTNADKTEIAVKAVGMIIIPTKTSQLTNDSGFLTSHQDISGKADKSDTYTKSEVDTAIENAMSATVPMVVTYADGTTETLNIVTQQEAS